MNKGFTLIELMAVLLLVGILAFSAIISLIPATEALLQVRANASSSQKAQFALSRIIQEFTTITNVASSSSTAITYDFLDPAGNSTRHAITWNGAPGNPLLLENTILTDDVGAFQLRYFATPGGGASANWSSSSRIIEIILQCLETGDRYTNRISPRNISGG